MWIKGLDSVLHSQIPEVNRYFRIFIMLASRGTFYNWHWFLLQAYLKVRKNFSKTALTFFFFWGGGLKNYLLLHNILVLAESEFNSIFIMPYYTLFYYKEMFFYSTTWLSISADIILSLLRYACQVINGILKMDRPAM